MIQLNVECYGGGLWHTWFDRDLSIAGRVILREDDKESLYFSHKLVKVNRPVLRIPNLCIHLRTAEERDVFKVNKEDHLIPILCSEVKKALAAATSNDTATPPAASDSSSWHSSQEPSLLQLLAEELEVSVERIVDFELSLFDTQGAALSGLRSEFVVGARIDNLASCFAAVEALVTHGEDTAAVEGDKDVSVVALFDHEEVGSESYAGAGSTLIAEAVQRIGAALQVYDASSADMVETHKSAIVK